MSKVSHFRFWVGGGEECLTLLFNGWKDGTKGFYLFKPNSKINSNTGNNIFKSKLDLKTLLPNGACPMHCTEKLSTEADTLRLNQWALNEILEIV